MAFGIRGGKHILYYIIILYRASILESIYRTGGARSGWGQCI